MCCQVKRKSQKLSPVYMIVKFYEVYPVSLNHLCRVDASTLSLWTGPFPIVGMSGLFFFIITMLYRNSRI